MKHPPLDLREGIRGKELLVVETWSKLSVKLKTVSFIERTLWTNSIGHISHVFCLFVSFFFFFFFFFWGGGGGGGGGGGVCCLINDTMEDKLVDANVTKMVDWF